MSSIKEYYFEKQQENCIAWIREQCGIEIDPDEHPEAWEDLAGEYSAMLEAEEAEYQWLNRHTHSEFFQQFANELATASSLLNVGTSAVHTDTLNKLVYAHIITLMEALISSVVRHLIVKDARLLTNLVAGYGKLSAKTITLKEIAEQPKVMESIAQQTLSELTFHNVATIKQILEAMFAEHMDGLKIAPIARICSKRHDIVHRNGKTVRDEPIDLTVEEVRDAMLVVRAFADDLQRRINNALDDGSAQI
ncbi:TPA: hypothetical protein ACXIHA_004347 [Pseudomonas aeruginosa]|uniref:hypothetical protein n=1 Tax=Pseudomonas aeruginosa TaxID=287 RepID=UPI000D6518FD|nr:hypothetical protein [Pseudomonas aeruginosa]EJB8403604.1 hypothetical protein [Pseudomonas aeruginosa]EKJ6829933.1 hypothetical protein [Pseudomonas aeruginosa]MBH4020955.1 hypothetical protein [Pseudomonas aeruginosa]MBX5547876.1 hypothetical protein [Pseudomonas aeruginosa]MBX5723283.1 hypothetical protein [Pseudomonas aeruginosa]